MNDAAKLVAEMVSGDEHKEEPVKATRQVNFQMDEGTLAFVRVLSSMTGTHLKDTFNLIISAGLHEIRQSMDPHDLNRWNAQASQLLHKLQKEAK